MDKQAVEISPPDGRYKLKNIFSSLVHDLAQPPSYLPSNFLYKISGPLILAWLTMALANALFQEVFPAVMAFTIGMLILFAYRISRGSNHYWPLPVAAAILPSLFTFKLITVIPSHALFWSVACQFFYYCTIHHRSATPITIVYIGLLSTQVYASTDTLTTIRWVVCNAIVGVMIYQFTKSLSQQYAETLKLSSTDELTQLLNRRALNKHLQEWSAYKQRNQSISICLVLMDLDHFKRINDELGHAIGDQVLQLFGKTLRDQVRTTDIAARFGGEEFALILPYTVTEGSEQVIERLRTALQEKTFADGKIIQFSAGISQLNNEDTIDTWLHRCDMALYEAKNSGRNCSRVA
jgi:diguanylate cyclase (GGDEF)-like protein